MEFPVIDPVAIAIGPLKVHWYGLMYMIGFAAAWWLGTVRAKAPNSGWTRDQVSDLVFYGAMGVILGGRLGYVFFYNFSKFLADPVWLFKVWDGGMSFHGGAIGVLVAFALFACKTDKRFFTVADFINDITLFEKRLPLLLSQNQRFVGEYGFGFHWEGMRILSLILYQR